MDDLISRQEAIDAIRASASKYTGFMGMEMYTTDDAVEAINGVPPAQPKRKKAVWIQTGMGSQCSNCWYKSQTTGDPQFCPSCGAEMN